MNKVNKRIPYAAVLGLIAVLLTACASPAATGTTVPGGAETGTTPNAVPQATEAGSVPETGGEIDQMFIDMMVPHHQGAVEMAKIAQERSQRPEIQEMARAIIASQEEEIGQMKTWKKAWYGSDETPPMSAMPMMSEMPEMGGMGHAMDMQADVDALRSAPEPFDLAFIDAMIPHHQSAIDAAQMVKDAAKHDEIRSMAQAIIDEQQKEIDQMKAWRKAWFPDAPQPEGSMSH